MSDDARRSPALGVEARVGIPTGLGDSGEGGDARPSPSGSMPGASTSDTADSHRTLAALIKEDLRHRFARGERPAVAEYLELDPSLRDQHSRVISLVYEEFCLLEEHDERPDPERFCARYAPWRDSLISQLRYHDAFSRVLTAPRRPVRYPEPGERFLRFQLDDELGRGGAGRVYLARSATLGGRRFALKVTPDRGDEPAIQGSLDHPHIVPVTSVEVDDATGLRGLCMPYWPGLPLNRVVERLDPARARSARALWDVLDEPDEDDRAVEAAGRPAWSGFPRGGAYPDAAAWVALKLAEALAYAHGRGVQHRDLKPANILLTRRGGPMLLDFNLSRSPNDAESAADAQRGGTLPYMAPEQLEAFLDPDRWDRVGPAADLYALGLVLRELVTGRRPDEPDPGLSTPRAVGDLLDRRRAPAPPPLRAGGPRVPRDLAAIIGHCLAPDPARRYAGAADLAEDLRRFLARKPPAHARKPSPLGHVPYWGARHRRLVTAALLLSPVLLGTALMMPGRGPGGAAPGALGNRNDRVAAPDRRIPDPDAHYPPDAGRAEECKRRGLSLAANDFTRANTHFQWAIALDPDLGRHSKTALPVFRRALGELPSFDYAFSQVGCELTDQQSDWKAAEVAFKLAIRLNPDTELAHCGLGTVYNNAGNLEGAAKEFMAALRINPHSYLAYQRLSLLAERRNDLRKCAEYRDLAIRYAKEANPKPRASDLATLYQQRAYSWLLQADDAGKRSRSSVDHDEVSRARADAGRYYRAALGDVEQCKRCLQDEELQADPWLDFKCEGIYCRSLLGLGVLISETDAVAARGHYRQARKHLDNEMELARKHGLMSDPRVKNQIESLGQELDRRLRSIGSGRSINSGFPVSPARTSGLG